MATTTNELTRPLYAAVGVTDRVVEIARGSVSDVQTRLVELQQGINKLEREPQALRARALEVPSQVQGRVNGFLEKHDVAYDQLVARGDALVRRIRRQKSTQDAVSSARTTSSKAKTTSTQSKNAGRSTASTTKRAAKNAASTATSTARRTTTAPQRSAKATATSAGRTAKSAAKAGAQATKKVGD